MLDITCKQCVETVSRIAVPEFIKLQLVKQEQKEWHVHL